MSGADASKQSALRSEDGLYDVGGVLLERPFKIRRLGHFGFSARNLAECLSFYRDDIGFKVSDPMDFAKIPPVAKLLEGIPDTHQYFMRHGTDHHSFVLADRRVIDRLYGTKAHKPTHSINQLTWQVGSLREVVDAISYFEEREVPINRTGRDMPGSNWHVYPFDPESHRNELYYGIEQIGWFAKGKPPALYERGFHTTPDLPQISEEEEVARAQAAGVDLASGFSEREARESTYDVDGILLPRPFKVVRIGPVGLYVEDVEKVSAFYTQVMGFIHTRDVVFEGHVCRFFRCNTEHHSLALYPVALRERLGGGPDSTCMSFGLQVANYRQLRDAVAYLAERGRPAVEFPGALFPGVDYAAAVRDPDGHTVLLYSFMEQVGPDGARAEPLNPSTQTAAWPERIPGRADHFMGESYLGPWG
jgi:catechol 2,3-dioxygenase-like lactoylglutathione lyase family enzyme